MRRISALILALILVLAFAFPVFAHPGRTDANGGHYDRSTGEYHYHNGYGSNKTSGDNPVTVTLPPVETSPSSNSNAISRTISSNISDSIQTKKREEVSISMPVWGIVFISVLTLVVVIQYFDGQSKKDTIDLLQREQSYDSKEIQDFLSTFDCALRLKYGENYIFEISDAPLGCRINRNMDDIIGNCGGDAHVCYHATCYQNPQTKVHKPYCRYASYADRKSVLTLQNKKYELCKICNPVIPDLSWAESAMAYIKFFKKFAPDSKAALDFTPVPGEENATPAQFYPHRLS